KKHRNTIYNKVEEGDILHRKMGTSILIYTRSLIFLLE
ncbi:MAG: DNA-binding protein, partial [Fusobacterium ulcerans]